MHKVIRRLSTNKAPAEIGSFLGPVFIPSHRVTTRVASDNMRCSLTEKLEIRGGREGGRGGSETQIFRILLLLPPACLPSSFPVIGLGMTMMKDNGGEVFLVFLISFF